ncbi:MAG: toll/interleukin-1 receptor domain-containing protein [Cyclobacteriaceae bacterium]
MGKPASKIKRAFISCSLRHEDREFVEFVEGALRKLNVKPVGTVGRHDAAPLSIATHMKENIENTDFVVVVATPRYVQKDVVTGKKSTGLSEMLHVESGMAYMAGKPVIVLAKEGTDLGSFLPQITQYVTLTGDNTDYLGKKNNIRQLINHAISIAGKAKLKKIGVNALAVIGGFKLLKNFFSR